MTIIWDQDTGKLYSEFLSEKDDFAEWHREEITMAYAKHLCEHNDFIEIRREKANV